MRSILILFLFSIVFASGAQSIKINEDIMHWEGGFIAGLNNDGYEMSFRGLYFPVQYVGLKVGIGFAGEIREMSDWGREEWYPGHTYTARFKLNPALALRTPRLVHLNSKDAGFYIFAEPGFVLSPSAVGRGVDKTFSWDLKCGINMQIKRSIFTIGYGISNFILYSGSHPMNFSGKPDYNTHTIFIGGSYKL
ncbi:MAG: hypothetical protein K2N09_09525 [Muribaculaceae bacterium]|nr:hypothetical protein [Muribaculaceae bacterium]